MTKIRKIRKKAGIQKQREIHKRKWNIKKNFFQHVEEASYKISSEENDFVIDLKKKHGYEFKILRALIKRALSINY